jgi:hypothetical protein
MSDIFKKELESSWKELLSSLKEAEKKASESPDAGTEKIIETYKKVIKSFRGAFANQGIMLTDMGNVYDFRSLDNDKEFQKFLKMEPTSLPPDEIDMEKVKKGVGLFFKKFSLRSSEDKR